MSPRTRRATRSRGAKRLGNLAQLSDLYNGRWRCEGQLDLFGAADETVETQQETGDHVPAE